MGRHRRSTALLVVLAAIFTVGLTFASVELPRVVDAALQDAVTTPGFDSQADAVARLKTELFIDHFHLRVIGYVAFALLVGLIAAGFASRRSGLAAAGGAALMLPVFAQFAGVMFFLAGLGLLNVVWLPVLDVSFELSRLGLVSRAPFDLLMRTARLVGIDAYWPLVVVFIAGGLLLFFLGTLAWLEGRATGGGVATSRVYRLSRHPQYLGWILWSYGVYMLLDLGRYPKRTWGISASLPWLLSTMVIVGVAMLEELQMERRYPEAYGRYRRTAPFLVPLPRVVEKLLALPTRLLFGRERPSRRREAAAVVVLYTAVLLVASFLLHGGGLAALTPERLRSERAERIARELREEPHPRRRGVLADRLAQCGPPAIGHVIQLLHDDDPGLRAEAAARLGRLAGPGGGAELAAALSDPDGNVRGHALRSLGEIGAGPYEAEIAALLDDPVAHVRTTAMQVLARIGSRTALPAAVEQLEHGEQWQRASAADALGTLGIDDAIAALVARLGDDSVHVRRATVIALLRVGSPAARAALETAADDGDWEVRLYAAEAVARLERQ